MKTIHSSLHLALLAATLLLTSAPTRAESTAGMLERISFCLQSPLALVNPATDESEGSFPIKIKDEEYLARMSERSTGEIVVEALDGTVAMVKIDKPQGDLLEQADWRRRWLEDVAGRAGVKVERKAFKSDAELLSVIRSRIGGQFMGLSVLIAPKEQVIAQFDWVTQPQYSEVAEFEALRGVVTKQVLPCALEKK